MHAFAYREGILHCEDVPLPQLAEAAGTPLYVYSSATLERHFDVFKAAFAPREVLIAYAVKANSNLAVLALLARRGAGADTVSAGEIVRALKAGVPPGRIIFSGVGKTADELRFAMQAGIRQINIESVAEYDLIESLAAEAGAAPALVFRVNPAIGAGGHEKISTGAAANKFGVGPEDSLRLFSRAAANPRLNPVGLAVHIGSQIRDLAPLAEAFGKIRAMTEQARAQGLSLTRLDLGGGLGVPYFHEPEPPSPAEYAAMVERVFAGFDIELAFEPGRLIAANAGVLLSRAIRFQERSDRRMLVVDAAMNDLLRPAMYDAHHDLWPVRQPAADAPRAPFDIVGPICETGDTFAKARALPPIAPGELVAFMTAGAYGAAMSSTYNSRDLAPEVLVRGATFDIVRERFGIEDQLKLEHIPGWLAPGGEKT